MSDVCTTGDRHTSLRYSRNAILKHAGSEAKGSNPTAGLTLLLARNPFRGNFNHWQVSQKEAGQIFLKRRHARDAGRITAAEMKYMRRTAGYIWTYCKTNTQIAKDLKITAMLDKLLEYKRNWIHVNRMPRNALPRVMKHYSLTGRRNHGRPLKRLLDT
jgi:hypothetical protein